MTDNDIIKALECCKSPIPMCDDCPVGESDMCFDFLKDYAIDLIKRQKAELEKTGEKWAELYADTVTKWEEAYEELEADVDKQYEQAKADILGNIADGGTSCHWCISQHRAEAIREFVERLFERVAVKTLVCKSEDYSDGFNEATCWYDEEIYNLLKEMTEETK